MDDSTFLYSALLSGCRRVLCNSGWGQAFAKCCCCRLRVSFWWSPDTENGKILLVHCFGILNRDPGNPPGHPVHGVGSQQYVWDLGRTRPGRFLCRNRNHYHPDRTDRQRCTRRSGHRDSVLIPLSISRFRCSLVPSGQRCSAVFEGSTSGAFEQWKRRRGDREENPGKLGVRQNVGASNARYCSAMLCHFDNEWIHLRTRHSLLCDVIKL